jgi:hypothetical protein
MFSHYSDIFLVNPTQEGTNLIAANPQPLINGASVDFIWLEWNRDEEYPHVGNYVEITDGTLSQLRILMNEDIDLEAVLVSLSRSRVIRATIDMYDLRLLFYFPDEKLIIVLTSNRTACSMRTIQNDFEVYQVHYLSETTYVDWTENYRHGTFYVPHQVWDDWMSGEVEGTCEEAIQALVDAAA